MKKKNKKIEKVKPTADRDKLRLEFYEGVKQHRWDLIETVRRFRIMLGLSQIDFAAYSGLTARAITEFEQGLRNPTVKTINKMLKGSGLELGIVLRRNALIGPLR